MPSEIAWADIAVKNRLPHMSKERFRRRGEGLKDASLLERLELSPSAHCGKFLGMNRAKFPDLNRWGQSKKNQHWVILYLDACDSAAGCRLWKPLDAEPKP